jgi:hypothetical protein
MKPEHDPDDDKSTLAHLVMRWFGRLREWAAMKAARHGRTVERQMIRGASYTLGSGAVSLLLFLLERHVR